MGKGHSYVSHCAACTASVVTLCVLSFPSFWLSSGRVGASARKRALPQHNGRTRRCVRLNQARSSRWMSLIQECPDDKDACEVPSLAKLEGVGDARRKQYLSKAITRARLREEEQAGGVVR